MSDFSVPTKDKSLYFNTSLYDHIYISFNWDRYSVIRVKKHGEYIRISVGKEYKEIISIAVFTVLHSNDSVKRQMTNY